MKPFEIGLLIGLLIGEGHFGGDGKQPQVSLRMHSRHEPLFRWLEQLVPGSRVYGPYHHGGRDYLQWMARGPALRNTLVPLLDSVEWAAKDPYAFERYQRMKQDYRISSPAQAHVSAPDEAH